MQKYAAPAAVGVALVLVAALAFWPKGAPHQEERSATPPGASGGEQVEMTMHIMSQCPHGVRVVDSIVPVARKLGSQFRLNLEYIGREQGSKLSSMHGEDEVNGNKIQLCVHKHGSYNAWLDFLECQNKSWRDIPEGWERCAREADLNVDELRECYDGEEGTRLVRASFRASKKVGASGSPTMFIDGEPYQGGRSEQDFARAVCAAYGDSGEPSYCNDIPDPPSIPITVLVDRRCEHDECNVDRQVKMLESRILGAKVTEVDYNTEKGRQIFEEAELKMLPAILVGREILQDRKAMRNLRGFKRAGSMFYDQVGRFDPVKGEWVPRPEIPIRVLADERCDTRECESLPRFEVFVKRMAPGAKIATIDYGTDEGRELWKQLSAAWEEEEPEKSPRGRAAPPLGLPVALFSKAIEQEAEAFGRLGRRFRPVGDEYAFQFGDWDPTAEICNNEEDDDGDRLVDCRDPDCREQRVCRREVPRKLQAFVMSQCPYGVQVVNAMEEVLKNFGRDRSKIDFRIEFIGQVSDEGELSSMHGEDEVNEDLRQICAQHHYGDNYAFMDYVLCRNKNYRSNEWESCATGPIKADVIRQCAEGDEGQRLLRESFELAKSLGIGGSPSWLLNNKLEMRGRSPEDIKDAFCEHNELPECENTLSKSGGNARGGC